MSATVSIPTILQTLTANQKRINISGNNIGDIINNIENQYPGFKARVMSDGKIHPFMNIYVNEDDIRFRENLNTEVSSNDLITILPAVAGG